MTEPTDRDCAMAEEGRRDAVTGQALAGLVGDRISSEAALAWLADAARYFSARNTRGEDAAHWANVANAQTCRRIADLIKALPEAGRREERERCARIADEYAAEVLPVDPGGVARLIAGRVRGDISVMDLVDYLSEKT